MPSRVSASHVENSAVLSFFCLIESQLLSPKWGNLSKLIHYNQIHFNVNSCDSRPMYLNYRVVCLCICAARNGFIYYSGCILGERCTICFFWCSSLQWKRFMFKSINTPYEAVSFSTSLPCFLPLVALYSEIWPAWNQVMPCLITHLKDVPLPENPPYSRVLHALGRSTWPAVHHFQRMTGSQMKIYLMPRWALIGTLNWSPVIY